MLRPSRLSWLPALAAAACGGGADIPALPVADAGFDQRGVQVGTVVILDGSGSGDPDGATLTYDWRLASRPEGSIAVLSRADQVNPSLQLDVPGTYLVTLQVSNGQRDSRIDVVGIEADNLSPVAVAACECPTPAVPSCAIGVCPGLHGSNVDLIGNDSSDPEGANLTYAWTQLTTLVACQAACGVTFPSCAPTAPGQTLGSATIGLTNPNQQSVTLVLPQVRDVHFVFELEVSDGFATDHACVSYLTTNTPPSFFAPARQSQDDYSQTAGVAFDIECSPDADDDGDTLDILWRQIAPPAPQALLATPTAQQTSVTVPGASITGDTVFFFEVQISDGVDSATQQISGITVSP